MNYLSNAKMWADNTEVNNQVLDFEHKSGILLPPIFRAFVEIYDLPSFSSAIFNKFYSHEFKDYFTFESATFNPNPGVVFYDLFMPAKYLVTKANVYHYEEDEVIIKDKICIGEIAGGLLLLGHEASNRDIIYADVFSDDDRPQKVGKNIFEFMKNIKLELDLDTLGRYKFSPDGLYKNWGEQHWNVKS